MFTGLASTWSDDISYNACIRDSVAIDMITIHMYESSEIELLCDIVSFSPFKMFTGVDVCILGLRLTMGYEDCVFATYRRAPPLKQGPRTRNEHRSYVYK